MPTPFSSPAARVLERPMAASTCPIAAAVRASSTCATTRWRFPISAATATSTRWATCSATRAPACCSSTSPRAIWRYTAAAGPGHDRLECQPGDRGRATHLAPANRERGAPAGCLPVHLGLRRLRAEHARDRHLAALAQPRHHRIERQEVGVDAEAGDDADGCIRRNRATSALLDVGHVDLDRRYVD